MRVRKEISVATGNTKSVLWLFLSSPASSAHSLLPVLGVASHRRGVRSLARSGVSQRKILLHS